MRSDREKLQDILESIQRIERYAFRGRHVFDSDELIQTWIAYHLQTIGEACRSLSAGIKNQNPQVPWQQIIGMRHILVHQYFVIDKDRLWAVVEDDLAALKSQIDTICAGLPPVPP